MNGEGSRVGKIVRCYQACQCCDKGGSRRSSHDPIIRSQLTHMQSEGAGDARAEAVFEESPRIIKAAIARLRLYVSILHLLTPLLEIQVKAHKGRFT